MFRLADREAADLLAGQVVAHPGRLGEVTLDPAALGGTAGAIVRVLREAHERDEDPDAALLAAGLLTSAADRMLWWWDAPRSVAELQRRLRDAHRRRLLAAVGRMLIEVAHDASPHLAAVLRALTPVDDAQRAEVITVLRWVLALLDDAPRTPAGGSMSRATAPRRAKATHEPVRCTGCKSTVRWRRTG